MRDKTDEQLSEDLRVAEEAKRVLDSEALKKAVLSLTTRYRLMWEESAPSDTGERERAYFRLRALKDLMEDLTQLVRDGDVAKIIREKRRKGA